MGIYLLLAIIDVEFCVFCPFKHWPVCCVYTDRFKSKLSGSDCGLEASLRQNWCSTSPKGKRSK